MEQNTVQKPDCAAITAQARQAAEELLAAAHLRAGDIFVVGCSSSEIVGGHIGKDSSMEAAAAVLAGILPVLKAQGVYLAAQCCEHLNRAIVIEQEAAEKYGYEQVNAVPQPHAGGSWATNCWQAFEHPVLVEEVLMAEWLQEKTQGTLQGASGSQEDALAAGDTERDTVAVIQNKIRGKVPGYALPEAQIVDLVHCFSREVEHSDENRGLLEDELVKREEFCLRALLAASVEWK